jgi:hypothetical protein
VTLLRLVQVPHKVIEERAGPVTGADQVSATAASGSTTRKVKDSST